MKKVISILLITIMCISIVPVDNSYAATNYTTSRYAGSSRYETSFEVCDALAKVKGGKFDNIVIACGSNFPDALSGGYLTNVKNAPMLLINQAQESVVLQYISKYMKSGGTVYILGGASVVRKAFETTLRSKGYKVKRLAGSGRYDTNLDILKEVTPEVKKHGTLLVSTGTGFADSLSASSVPYPIMLVGNSLTSEQKNWIKSTGIKKIYILGGTGAVNKTIETELKKYGTVERISGNTRYDTSIAIANKFYPKAKYITLVYGANFPDGLSGAPIAAHYGSPIVLVSANNYAHARNYVLAKDIWADITIGGPAVVSNATIDNIMKRNNNTQESNTHSYGNPSWIWTEYTKATAVFRCTAHPKEQEVRVNATITNKVTTAATCAAAGVKTYTATVKFNNKTYTNTKAQSLSKTSHNYVWAGDLNNHWKKCSNCGVTYGKEAHTYRAGKCTVCNRALNPKDCKHDYDIWHIARKYKIEDLYCYGWEAHCATCRRNFGKGEPCVVSESAGPNQSDSHWWSHLGIYLDETKGFRNWTTKDMDAEAGSSRHSMVANKPIFEPTYTMPFKILTGPNKREYYTWKFDKDIYKYKNSFTATVNIGECCAECGGNKVYYDKPKVFVQRDKDAVMQSLGYDPDPFEMVIGTVNVKLHGTPVGNEWITAASNNSSY